MHPCLACARVTGVCLQFNPPDYASVDTEFLKVDVCLFCQASAPCIFCLPCTYASAVHLSLGHLSRFP